MRSDSGFEGHIRFQEQSISMYNLKLKWHVTIVIKTGPAGFAVTLHWGMCK